MSKSISTWVSLSCCCWRVDWNCSNAYRSCTDTIQNTLNNIWNQLKVISTQKNIINRAGNSDEWCTQNCPPQNCPPKGISRAGNSDIHPISALFSFCLSLNGSARSSYSRPVIVISRMSFGFHFGDPWVSLWCHLGDYWVTICRSYLCG